MTHISFIKITWVDSCEKIQLAGKKNSIRNVKFYMKYNINIYHRCLRFKLRWPENKTLFDNEMKAFDQSFRNLPTTVGSKSMKIDRGTNFPETVSLKNVVNDSSGPTVEESFIRPSAKMPCSRQYNSQQALPICTPAWPIWREIHSRWKKRQPGNKPKTIAIFVPEGTLIKLLETFNHISYNAASEKFATKKRVFTLSLIVILIRSIYRQENLLQKNQMYPAYHFHWKTSQILNGRKTRWLAVNESLAFWWVSFVNKSIRTINVIRKWR